jgi:hypothetical protein
MSPPRLPKGAAPASPSGIPLSPLRADKETVVSLVVRSAPELLEILNECKDAASWRKFSDMLAERRTTLKVNDYHVLYEDEKRIGYIMFRVVMSQEDIKQYSEEFAAATPEAQQAFLRDLAKTGGIGEQLADEMFPDDDELLKQKVAEFEQMEDGPEKQEVIQRGQFLLAFFLAWFHEVMAVMVHGEKMTSLIPKALAGDKDAFLLAIHIDKALITLHPKFIEIYQQAIRDGDKDFLDKVSYRLASPLTKGRVKLAGIFAVFAMLESLGWLNEFKHREILAICDEVDLDRWENKIEDESAVSKALTKYRRYQKTGGVSMH